MKRRRSSVVGFVFDNSLLLLIGTAAAVLWANLDLATDEAFADPLHFRVNEIGMVFFFALAAKEVLEATLPGGALASLRQALSALAAAVGGMVAPAAICTSLALTLGPASLRTRPQASHEARSRHPASGRTKGPESDGAPGAPTRATSRAIR